MTMTIVTSHHQPNPTLLAREDLRKATSHGKHLTPRYRQSIPAMMQMMPIDSIRQLVTSHAVTIAGHQIYHSFFDFHDYAALYVKSYVKPVQDFLYEDKAFLLTFS